MNVKVYNQFNKPKHSKQNVHQEIYEYDEIIEKTGEVKHHKINVQERIQSNLNKVDYKRMIASGEMILNGNILGEGIRDFTSLPGDKADLIDLVAQVSRLTPEQISGLTKSLAENTQISGSQNNQENQQTTTTTPKVEPNNSGDTGEASQGGTK